MDNDNAPKPPLAGIIYGEVAYWVALLGMVITIAGMAVYMISGGYIQKDALLTGLWQGCDCQTIWKNSTSLVGAPHGHWYLTMLPHGDALATLGIAVISFGGVVGSWGALVGMVKTGAGIYILFALMVAAVLTLSALGIIAIKE